MRAVMNLLQTFIGLPHMTSVSIGFMDLVDATGRRHPVPMDMAFPHFRCVLTRDVIFRNVCAQEWCIVSPRGSAHAFKVYYDAWSTEQKQVRVA